MTNSTSDTYPTPRSRGISQFDVASAADAILAAGQRPTIERVRHHLGRGSPNTVGPMLDVWFRTLGRRLSGGGGGHAPSSDDAQREQATAPLIVNQAVSALWSAALQAADEQFRQLRIELTEAAEAGVRSAQQEATLAVARASDFQSELAAAKAALQAIQRDLETERLERQRLEMARQADAEQLERMALRLTDLQTENTTLKSQASEVRTQASERVAAAERRAAIDMDRERTARGAAEKRASQLESRLEESRLSSTAEIQRLLRDVTRLEVAELTWQERLRGWQLEREALRRETAAPLRSPKPAHQPFSKRRIRSGSSRR